jgi:hypothetical protein
MERDETKLREEQVFFDDILRMPITEACERVDILFSSTDHFICTENRLDFKLISDPLAEYISTFFREYEVVSGNYSDLLLSLELIGPSEIDARYTRIGVDIIPMEYVVLPGRETVYMIDGLEKDSEPLVSYPSVYHVVLCEEREHTGRVRRWGRTDTVVE